MPNFKLAGDHEMIEEVKHSSPSTTWSSMMRALIGNDQVCSGANSEENASGKFVTVLENTKSKFPVDGSCTASYRYITACHSKGYTVVKVHSTCKMLNSHVCNMAR